VLHYLPLTEAAQLVSEILTAPTKLRPLIKLDALTGFLDMSPRDIAALRESGQLGAVFDVRSSSAHLPCYRIWVRSAVDVIMARRDRADCEAALAEILPERERLTTRDLRHILDVGHDHAQAIARELEPLQAASRGVNGSAIATTDSLRAWLRSRAS
jgi:hypothetical protein